MQVPISAVIREGVWTITQGYNRESASEHVTLSDVYQERQSVWALKFRVVHLSSASRRLSDSFNCTDDLSSSPAACREPGHSAQVHICRLKILQRGGEFSCMNKDVQWLL